MLNGRQGTVEGVAMVALQIAQEQDAKLRIIENLLNVGDDAGALTEMRAFLNCKKPNARATVYGNQRQKHQQTN